MFKKDVAMKHELKIFRDFEAGCFGLDDKWVIKRYLKKKQNILNFYVSRKSSEIREFILQKEVTLLLKYLLRVIPHSDEMILFSKDILQDYIENFKNTAYFFIFAKDSMLDNALKKLLDLLKGKDVFFVTEVANIVLSAYDPYTGIEHGDIFANVAVKHIDIINTYIKNNPDNLDARKYEVSNQDKELMYYAAKLHDFGKLLVTRKIINFPGDLRLVSETDRKSMEAHPAYGLMLLELFGIDNKIYKDLTASHHRSTQKRPFVHYPYRRSQSKIIEISDNFDALASNRYYRPAPYYLKLKDIVASLTFKASQGGLDSVLTDITIDNSEGLKEMYYISRGGIIKPGDDEL